MPVYEVQTPDGRTFKVEAPDMETAAQSAQEYAAQSAQPRSASVEDFISGTGAFGETPGPVDPIPMSGAFADPGRALQIGAQGAGRGLADLAGLPADLANMAADAPLAGADWVAEQFGGDVDFRFGPSPVGGNAIAERAGATFESLGGDLIDQSEMSPSEQAMYNINRYGTEAVVGGGGLAKQAQKRFAPAPRREPRFGDNLLKPYAENPTRTLRGDAMAGAGAGAGLTVAQDQDFGQFQPLVDLGAMLAGGLGGAVISDFPRGLASMGRGIYESLTPDPNVPLDAAMNSTSRRTSRRAATVAQDLASDPQKAAETIGERTAAARRAGDPVATSGLLSDDPGLVSAEQSVRIKDRTPFVEQDRRLAEAASERVSDLTDVDAEQSAATRAAQERPIQLAAERDEAALPLLRQAEQSGAVVDPQPVADKIDQMLTQAKRPAVRSALTEARNMLNRPGTDELDTSVSGLYETRKAINDIIEGRSDTPTGRYAKKELIEVRDALDEQINVVAPEFGQYLKTYREGSEPINELTDSKQVARLMQEDPRDVASKMLSGGNYASAGKMSEITKAIGDDPEAMRAWRAAVAEVLSDKVRNVGGAVSRAETLEGPVSIAKLRKVFQQHEDALAGVFSEDDMASLRRAHDVLAPLENRRMQATSGSPTAENRALAGAWDALGTALTFKYGAVHAGMVMHRMKRALNLAPGMKNLSLDNRALQVVNRMWFDPDLAKHLLEAPTDEISTPRWNRRLAALIGAGELAREDEVDDETGAIMRGGEPTIPDDEMERAINGN